MSLLAIAALAALGSQPAAAGTISVGWDPVSHPDLAGYHVYYATAPGAYTGSVDVGNVTGTTLEGLSSCTDYHVSVKAYTSTGSLSAEYSQEVGGWPRPELVGVSLSELERGAEHQIVLDGANFKPGAELLFSAAGINVEDMNVTSCTQVVMTLSVATDAALGPVDLTYVNNPSRVYGQASGIFTIVGDGTAPSVLNLTAGSIGATAATITWSTSEPATAELGYRKAGTASWITRSSGGSTGTGHAVALTGLEPDTTYEYRVEATDGAGNGTVSETQTFETSHSSHSFIRIEAEMGQISGALEVAGTASSSAFRGSWLRQKTGTPNGSPASPQGVATVGFHVPYQASWHVWLRMAGDASNSNGWYEAMDDGGYQGLSPQPDGAWHWAEARTYDLAAGLHELRLGGHEQQARLDRIIITDDPDFVPSETPNADVVPPTPVADLSLEAGDTLNTLRWTDPSDGDAMTLVIRYRTDGSFPTTPADGLPLVETDVVPGSPGVYDHNGLVNDTPYSYSVFTIDASGNASAPMTIDGTPETAPPPSVGGLHRTDTL